MISGETVHSFSINDHGLQITKSCNVDLRLSHNSQVYNMAYHIEEDRCGVNNYGSVYIPPFFYS